jgi:nucleotide-binding universal stress UspA family protein
MNAYRRILAAVDGSAASDKGLREALRLARSERAQLLIVHVVNELFPYVGVDGTAPIDVVPVLRESGRKVLARAAAAAAKQGVKAKAVMREVFGGPAADTILREARKAGADLIVLGTHGRRGVRRMVLGSDAEQVVRGSRVPVLLVRAGA